MIALDFFILGMATWRITSLLVREQGPWNIFERIRELSGIIHDEDGNVLAIPDNFFADVLSCVWCCSIWVAFGWSIVFFIYPVITWVAIPFALSSITIFLDKLNS